MYYRETNLCVQNYAIWLHHDKNIFIFKMVKNKFHLEPTFMNPLFIEGTLLILWQTGNMYWGLKYLFCDVVAEPMEMPKSIFNRPCIPHPLNSWIQGTVYVFLCQKCFA
jgi:hypothetical protein